MFVDGAVREGEINVFILITIVLVLVFALTNQHLNTSDTVWGNFMSSQS